MPESETRARPIGLAGAVVTQIGLVIGASIFSLPGALAASAGPAVIVSFLLASVVAFFTCVAAAQIGGLFPVAGASYVAISRMLSPFFGFLGLWLVLLGAAIGVAFLSYVFADYAIFSFGLTADRRATAAAVVVALAALNAFSTRAAISGQALMVAMFMLALAVFCIAGIANIDTALLQPFAPNGWSPVVSAAIPAFFSFVGFMMIVELSGEIRTPGRTILWAQLISFTVVLLVYTAVSLAIVGSIETTLLAEIRAPVGTIATAALPAWLAAFVSLAALPAAATSVNGILLGYSRDVLVLSRAGIIPGVFARMSGEGRTPANAVLLIASASLLCVIAGGRITDYASILVLAFMLLQILLGLALWRTRDRLDDAPGKPGLLCNRFAIGFSSIGLIAGSLLFLVIGLASEPKTGIVAIVYTCAGAAYFAYRQRHPGRQTRV